MEWWELPNEIKRSVLKYLPQPRPKKECSVSYTLGIEDGVVIYWAYHIYFEFDGTIFTPGHSFESELKIQDISNILIAREFAREFGHYLDIYTVNFSTSVLKNIKRQIRAELLDNIEELKAMNERNTSLNKELKFEFC